MPTTRHVNYAVRQTSLMLQHKSELLKICLLRGMLRRDLVLASKILEGIMVDVHDKLPLD